MSPIQTPERPPAEVGGPGGSLVRVRLSPSPRPAERRSRLPPNDAAAPLVGVRSRTGTPPSRRQSSAPNRTPPTLDSLADHRSAPSLSVISTHRCETVDRGSTTKVSGANPDPCELGSFHGDRRTLVPSTAKRRCIETASKTIRRCRRRGSSRHRAAAARDGDVNDVVGQDRSLRLHRQGRRAERRASGLGAVWCAVRAVPGAAGPSTRSSNREAWTPVC